MRGGAPAASGEPLIDGPARAAPCAVIVDDEEATGREALPEVIELGLRRGVKVGVEAEEGPQKGKHEPAWQKWWAQQVALSRQYQECERRAGKWFTIEDIDLERGPEDRPGHFDSRPSAAEFMAHWTVQVATNMDVEAEARGRPRGKFRPDSEEFLKAEEQAAENRPDEGADEEKGVGAPGGALYGLAQEVDDADDVDAAWEKTRQEPRFHVKDDEVPKVAQCDGIRGSSKALVYRNSFLEGYAQDHRPQITGANRGRAAFGGLEHLDQRIFDDAKAQQKEKFRYRKTGAEGLPEEGSGGAGLASLAPGVLVTGRPPAPAVESKEKSRLGRASSRRGCLTS